MKECYIKCNGCNRPFSVNASKNGLPAGVGFRLVDGEIISLCQACLTRMGKMNEREKNKFIEDVSKKMKEGKQ